MELDLPPCCERERESVASVYQAFVAAVIRVGDLAYRSESDEEFYQEMLNLAVGVVPGAQAGSIQLALEGTTRFRFIAAIGFDLGELQKQDLDRSDFFRDPGVPTTEIVKSIGLQTNDPNVLDWIADAGKIDDIETTLSAPVIVDGETVAFAALDNFDDADAFDDTGIEMMTVLSRFIGDLIVRRRLESQLRAERETLRVLATRDPLTGLANRREFNALLRSSLERTSESLRPAAVLFIDLDDLKLMNDTHGHDVGDEVLRAVGQRIEGALRTGDVVARWGGDEFLVLLARVDVPDEAVQVGERILGALERPIHIGAGATEKVSVSIGVGWSFDSQITAEGLLALADRALYGVKAEHKGSVRMHKA